MNPERKNSLMRMTAVPLSLLVCGGLYFGAYTAAGHRFSSVLESASEPQLQQLEGLWSYNALSAREQQIYTVLQQAMEERQTRTAQLSFVPTQTEFTAAYNAVLRDYPMYCDLQHEACVLLSAEHSAQISLAYLPNGETRREALLFCVSELIETVSLQDPSAAALQLHDLLTACCSYVSSDDTSMSVGDTAYDALVAGNADSMGYALAYALLCREAGVSCAVVTGAVSTGEQSGFHAWNITELDGSIGYTDVMWNDAAVPDDGEAAGTVPFHGYYFLSEDEMSADHMSDQPTVFIADNDTQNYYETKHLCADSADALEQLLITLLSDARQTGTDTVEFWLDPQLHVTGYVLEEAISAAVSAANADPGTDAPLLRHVNRVYRTSMTGGGMTVQLFYEEND